MKANLMFAKLLTVIVLLFSIEMVFSQGVGVNNTNNLPDNSAMLDVVSTEKGFLMPRLNTNQMISILSPAVGLTIFNTDSLTFCYYTGTQWYCLCVCDSMIDTVATPWMCGDSIIDSRDGQKYATVQIGTQCWMAQNLNIGSLITGLGVEMGPPGTYTPQVYNNGIIEKYCYNNDPNICKTDGGYYQWEEMMQATAHGGGNHQGVCPIGWHLPTHNEWLMLEYQLGMCSGSNFGPPKCADLIGHWRGTDQGNQLKKVSACYSILPDCSGLNTTYTNCNTSGFTAILAGCYSGASGINRLAYRNAFDEFWTATICTFDSRPYVRQLSPVASCIHLTTYDKDWGLTVRCIKD